MVEIQWASCISCACSPTMTRRHTAEQHAGGDEHVAVGESLLHNECKNGDETGEAEAEERAFEDDAPAKAQVIGLQKEDDFEAFAVKGGEPEQDQTPNEARVCEALASAPLVRRVFAPAIVRPDPAAPINLVEEPVHDDEQDDDGAGVRWRPAG